MMLASRLGAIFCDKWLLSVTWMSGEKFDKAKAVAAQHNRLICGSCAKAGFMGWKRNDLRHARFRQMQKVKVAAARSYPLKRVLDPDHFGWNLSDHECEHGRFYGDKTPACGCWLEEQS